MTWKLLKTLVHLGISIFMYLNKTFNIKHKKNPPTMQEIRVQSLDLEDSLEEEMATHSIIVTWRIPRTEESDGLQSMGLQRV